MPVRDAEGPIEIQNIASNLFVILYSYLSTGELDPPRILLD
jgi:hypothetical protein